MPFRSEKQRRFMFANHPDIAKRWTAEYGSTPQPSSGQGQKHKGSDDFKGLVPGAVARHTPKRADEQQASRESGQVVSPGGFPGPLGAAKHKGLHGRDVRAAMKGR